MSGWGSGWGFPWGGGRRFGSTDSSDAVQPIPLGTLDAPGSAFERIWKQYEGAPNWLAILRDIIGVAFADAEQSAWRALRRTKVDAADGVWLDEIGAMVGRARGGQTDDDDYTLAIIADALSQVTDGSPEDMIALAVRLGGPGATVIYDEPAPAAFVLTVADLPPGRFALILDVGQDMPPAGVGAFLATYDSALTGGWGWDPNPPGAGSWGYDNPIPGVRSVWGWAQQLGT